MWVMELSLVCHHANAFRPAPSRNLKSRSTSARADADATLFEHPAQTSREHLEHGVVQVPEKADQRAQGR